MLNLIIACDLVIMDKNFTSTQRILALKFLKNAMDLRNQKFANYFQIHALDTFYQIALLSSADSEQDIGKHYFSENPGFY